MANPDREAKSEEPTNEEERFIQYINHAEICDVASLIERSLVYDYHLKAWAHDSYEPRKSELKFPIIMPNCRADEDSAKIIEKIYRKGADITREKIKGAVLAMARKLETYEPCQLEGNIMFYADLRYLIDSLHLSEDNNILNQLKRIIDSGKFIGIGGNKDIESRDAQFQLVASLNKAGNALSPEWWETQRDRGYSEVALYGLFYHPLVGYDVLKSLGKFVKKGLSKQVFERFLLYEKDMGRLEKTILALSDGLKTIEDGATRKEWEDMAEDIAKGVGVYGHRKI